MLSVADKKKKFLKMRYTLDLFLKCDIFRITRKNSPKPLLKAILGNLKIYFSYFSIRRLKRAGLRENDLN